MPTAKEGWPVVIVIAGSPTPKGRPRYALIRGRDGQPMVRGGHVLARSYTPARTKRYEGYVRLAAQQMMAGRPPYDGPVSVDLEVTMRPPASWSRRRKARALRGEERPTKKPDGDNVEKLVWDALSDVVFVDDKQVVRWSGRKEYGERDAVRVTVRQVDSDTERRPT